MVYVQCRWCSTVFMHEDPVVLAVMEVDHSDQEHLMELATIRATEVFSRMVKADGSAVTDDV